jgi:hypothetical protein
VLTETCSFLGLQYDDKMMSEYGDVAANLITDKEPWKSSIAGGIRDAGATKFYQVFDESQRQHVLERIAAAGLSDLEAKLADRAGSG